MNEPIRVLVFGTSGVGKTSLCNIVTGTTDPQAVSDAAVGCTFKTHVFSPFTIDDKLCIFTDTIGLNESDNGKVPAKDALKELIALLKHSKDGYNLLIHVMRIPRITKAEQNNYEFFIKLVADSKIPAILVATGCENVEPMSDWKNNNENIFSTMGLHYKDIICTCFAEDGKRYNYSDLREESRRVVTEAIMQYSTKETVLIFKTDAAIVRTFKRCWNWLVNNVGFNKLKVGVNKAVQEILMRFGFSEEEAAKEAENFK